MFHVAVLKKHLISAVDIIKEESGQAERQGRNESGGKMRRSFFCRLSFSFYLIRHKTPEESVEWLFFAVSSSSSSSSSEEEEDLLPRPRLVAMATHDCP